MTSNFNRRLRKMKSSLNVCPFLKLALHASPKAKSVDKGGNEVLAHCDKLSNRAGSSI